ncbi:MAG: hypothetical protein HQP61_04985 [Peptococcaceae bacterium]|nr:hypothetical protein [Candidatus Syntrophopropionicum ammoniitolerans]
MPVSEAPGVKGKTGQKTKPHKNKLSILLLVAVFLAGLFTGGYYYVNSPGAAGGSRIMGAAMTSSLDLGEIVVNINGDGRGHYLRVNVTIEYPKDRKLSRELAVKRPQLLDIIITTLRSKTLEEVGHVGSVDVIRDNLLEEINKNLDSGRVTTIYFTDYLFH